MSASHHLLRKLHFADHQVTVRHEYADGTFFVGGLTPDGQKYKGKGLIDQKEDVILELEASIPQIPKKRLDAFGGRSMDDPQGDVSDQEGGRSSELAKVQDDASEFFWVVGDEKSDDA